jgi:hypothetical protein
MTLNKEKLEKLTSIVISLSNQHEPYEIVFDDVKYALEWGIKKINNEVSDFARDTITASYKEQQ